MAAGMIIQLGIFVLVAGTAALLFFGLRGLLAGENQMQRRLREVGAAADDGAVAGTTRLGEHRDQEGSAAVEAALGMLAAAAKPDDEQDLAGITARLSHAGYRGEQALRAFFVAKLVLCITLGVVVWVFETGSGSVDDAYLHVVLALGAGYYAPNIWLSGRISERQTLLNQGLPDAMDLLVTCVEAGLALEASLDRIAGEVKLAAPLLAEELVQSSLEMRAGLTRGEAFRRLAERTGVEELRYLASVIVQAELFGTSVAKSLRVMSEGMRLRRTQKAEANAAAASVKMTIPLVCCILPSLFTLLLGPAAINIMRTLSPALGGSQ